VVGGIQKLTAVFTLYRVILNFFSAEGTLFHYHLSLVEQLIYQFVFVKCYTHRPGATKLFVTYGDSKKVMLAYTNESSALSSVG
jgi:hypothetical protein